MEAILLIALWLILGIPGYAIVLGDLQRDEFDCLGLQWVDVVLSLAYLALGPVASVIALLTGEGHPPRLIPKQFLKEYR